jgi:hypothetical protein
VAAGGTCAVEGRQHGPAVDGIDAPGIFRAAVVVRAVEEQVPCGILGVHFELLVLVVAARRIDEDLVVAPCKIYRRAYCRSHIHTLYSVQLPRLLKTTDLEVRVVENDGILLG